MLTRSYMHHPLVNFVIKSRTMHYQEYRLNRQINLSAPLTGVHGIHPSSLAQEQLSRRRYLLRLRWSPKRLNTQRAGPIRLLPGLAGADLIFQWIGMVEYIPCYSAPAVHWDLLPATRLQAGKYLLSKISKGDRANTLCTLWWSLNI